MTPSRACAVLIVAALAAPAFIGLGSAAAQPSDRPAVCDAPPAIFAPGSRKPLDPAHVEILALKGREAGPDRARRAGALLPAMRARVAGVATRNGPVAAALAKSDLADLLLMTANPDQGEIASLRREALAASPKATDVEATEVMIVLDRMVNGQREGAEAYPHALATLERHRRAAGDVPRAIPLWKAALDKAPSAAIQERLAREQLRAAERTGASRWLLDARDDLIAALLRARTGRSATDIVDNGQWRAVLRGLGAGGDEILALARAMLPELQRRLPWAADRTPCSWISWNQADRAARVLIVLGSEAEGRAGLALVVRVTATGEPFGSDYAGALSNLAPILAARAIDRPLFLEGMRSSAAASNIECPVAPRAIEVCALRIVASAYVEIGAPGSALPLMRDAVEVAERAGGSPEGLADLLVGWAEIEWGYGTASDAPALLARAERLMALGTSLPRTEAEVRAVRLRAIIADAQLEDDLALDAFRRIVAAALTANRTLSLGTRATMSGNPGADPYKFATYRAATELVRRHVRRRFCTGCTAPSGIAQPALDWLSGVFDPGNPKAFAPTANDVLLLRSLPEAAWPAPRQRAALEQFRRVLPQQSGTDGIGALPAFEEVRRRLSPSADLANALRTTALSMIVSAGASDPAEAGNFVAFLIERDIERKRQLWKSYLDPIAENNYEQFGAETNLNEDLDALARGAMFSGYALAARVVFESLLDRLAAGAAKGLVRDAAGHQALRAQAGLVVPALARLAGFATDRREYDLAHRLLDTAALVVRERLSEEWQVGNERAAVSLRELRGATRLNAQLRFRLMEDLAGRAVVPDGAARLFSDLQLAMLSETALASQAADRRRVAADVGLAQALRERDELGRAIAAAERFRFVGESYGLTATEVQVKRLEDERARAAATVSRLLPVAEDLVSPAPLTLVEAQRALAADEGLLLLHAGTDAVYGFLVTSGRPPTMWTTRLSGSSLEARIKAVRDGVDLSGGALPRFPFEAAAELHTLLLGPAHEALAGVRHLLVVTDGPLQSLPLAVLPTDRPAEMPATPEEIRRARVNWLVRRRVVRVLWSVWSVARGGVGRLASRAVAAFAGIGAPVLSGAPGSARGLDLRGALSSAGTADVEVLRRMASLPETADEVRALGERLGARPQDLLLGAAATEAAVKRMPLKTYRIITFATHGLIAGTIAGAREPGLVLTPPSRASAEDDGYLSASEIAQLDLDADLVILSACNTAAADGRPRAEGLSGLARAFMTAGARGVIATHWAIPSAPTVEVTTRLVAQLSSTGPSRDNDGGRALQRAMLAVADEVGPPEYAHPANWGAFVAVGSPGLTQ